MSEQKQKIFDGRMMEGICAQWFFDEYGFGNKDFELYLYIVRQTFGYKKRYAYIKQSKFSAITPKTLKVYRDKLVERGVLEWKSTKNMTMYQIVEPAEYIENFNLNGRALEGNTVKQEDVDPDAEAKEAVANGDYETIKEFHDDNL